MVITSGGKFDDLWKFQCLAALFCVVALQGGAGADHFHASLPTAVAWGLFAVQGVVTPLAANPVGSGEDVSVHHDATSDTGSQNDAEDGLVSLSRTQRCLC